MTPWFPTRAADTGVALFVWRHVVGGDGGNILFFATNGERVVSVATHLTADLMRVEEGYPAYLTDKAFVRNVLTQRAWANTCPPRRRAWTIDNKKNISRTQVSVHQKMLAVALVETGGAAPGQLADAGWPTLRPNSAITAESFSGRAYCSLHTDVAAQENGTDNGGPGPGNVDTEWRNRLDALAVWNNGRD